MRVLRRIVLQICLVLLLLPVAGCDQQGAPTSQGEDTFYRVKRSGTLKVGFVVLAPWVQKDPRDGKLSAPTLT